MQDKNVFDTEIKTKMATYEVKPPEEIWTEINKKRSFGHITTNRIIHTFYLLGAIAFVVGMGNYYYGWTSPVEGKYSPIEKKQSVKSKLPFRTIQFNRDAAAQKSAQQPARSRQFETVNPPTQDLTASIGGASVHLSPALFADQSLQRLLEHVDDISIVEPFELVKYKRLSRISSQPSQRKEINAELRRGESRYLFPEPSSGNHFSLSLSLSPEFIKKDFSLKNFLPPGYVDNRKNYIRSRKAFTVSARGIYHWGRHSFVETGIELTSISEKTQTGSSLLSSQFYFLSVPVLFGQEVRFNRITWQIKSGIAYQFYSDFKGTVLGADGISSIDLNASDIPYRSAGVYTLHLSSGISYQCSENLSLKLEPYYKRNLNSISTRNSDFTEKIEYMGIAAGACVDL